MAGLVHYNLQDFFRVGNILRVNLMTKVLVKTSIRCYQCRPLFHKSLFDSIFDSLLTDIHEEIISLLVFVEKTLDSRHNKSIII